MAIFIWSLVFFCSALAIHLVVWKFRVPARQTRTLLLIFGATLAAGSVALLRYSVAAELRGIPLPEGIWEYLHICMIVVSLALAYIVTYSALEVDSPSLVMVLAIADAGPEGLEKEEFHRRMTDDRLVKPRVRDLLRDGLATLDGDRYRPTPKGRSFIKVFIYYRRLLSLPLRGG